MIPVGDHLAIINAALSADGIPQDQWPMWQAGMNTLIQRESGWNAGAVNNWDSNAKAGTPSGGLAQVIGPTFAAYRNRSLVDNLLDPVANVAASINYILGRYGSISKVAQANPNLPPQGYDEGGYLQPGMSRVLNATGRPEPVFSSRQWDVLKGHLKSGKGGDTNHYHITTTDPIAVATEIERRNSLNLTSKL
jgi:SLT domain-containing protein